MKVLTIRNCLGLDTGKIYSLAHDSPRPSPMEKEEEVNQNL